jgi:F-type H+-transporting ATPase subunit gamma
MDRVFLDANVLFSVAYRPDAGLPLIGLFAVPNSVKAITPLVGQVLVESETLRSHYEITELHLFNNRPTFGGVYASVSQQRLPLEENRRR